MSGFGFGFDCLEHRSSACIRRPEPTSARGLSASRPRDAKPWRRLKHAYRSAAWAASPAQVRHIGRSVLAVGAFGNARPSSPTTLRAAAGPRCAAVERRHPMRGPSKARMSTSSDTAGGLENRQP